MSLRAVRCMSEADSDAAAAQAAHDRAVAAGHEGYIDPASGLFVMTGPALRSRGYCCSNGCRHCPFEPS